MDHILTSYIESKKKYNSLCLNEENNLIKYCFFNNNNYTCKVLYNLYNDCIKFKKLKQ